MGDNEQEGWIEFYNGSTEVNNRPNQYVDSLIDNDGSCASSTSAGKRRQVERMYTIKEVQKYIRHGKSIVITMQCYLEDNS
jgi:hypothetical protein